MVCKVALCCCRMCGVATLLEQRLESSRSQSSCLVTLWRLTIGVFGMCDYVVTKSTNSKKKSNIPLSLFVYVFAAL